MSALPPFAVTSVGSWPRSAALLKALPSRRQGTLTAAGFLEVARKDFRACVQAQERAGVDRVTDGEQTRDNFYSFVAERLDGVQLMTLAEMLDVVEDKAGFQSLLDTLDVPAFAISNPTCVGALALREPLAVDDLAFVRTQTSKPIKVTLPGPYLLTRAMWVPEVSRHAYDSKEALGTFMCAALAARKDPPGRTGVRGLAAVARARGGGLDPRGKELGLGVVNPRSDAIERVEDIVPKVLEALRWLRPEQVFLNPDCGFGTFSARPMNTVVVAERKLEVMAVAARELRRLHA